MGDLLGILCVLTLVLCLITFLGHGIWVVLASLFAPSAKETSVQAAGIQSRPPRPRCHVCGLLPENDDQACRRCGTRLLTIPQAANARDALASVEDQLRRLWNLGQVDQDAYERVFGILRAEQQRLELDQSPAAPTEQHDVGARVPPLPAQRNAEARHATTTKPQLPLPFGETAGVTVQPPEPSMDMVSLAISGAVETDQAEPATIKNSTQDDVARVPVAPRKTWGEVFASFMEERHLRWGELVGGLMIVCGSIALVLSFWGQIAQRPFLKFFVFNGVTAGLFGLGFYTDRRMKLPNTGQAVLMIASLLVPLNFLALAAFSRDAVDLNVVTLAGEAVSIIVFCTLLRTAGPTIASRTPWGFAIGVLVPSIGTLLVRRFIDPASGEPMLVMVSVLLLAFYVGTTAWLHWRSRMESEFSEQLANEHFRLLGMATFAAILPLGLLAFRAGNVAEALRVLSPLAAIVAAPPLAVGLRIWQGTKVPGLAGVRTAACAVAIAGAGILLLGIAIGWPHPASLVPAAIVAAVCLSVLGATYRIPAAQVLVAVAVTISGVIIFHVTNGTIAWRSADAFVLLDVLVGGETGWALAGVALGLLLLAGAWSAARFQRDAIVLTRSAFTVACLSLIFVTGHGWGRPGDPLGVVWFLSAAGLVLLTGAVILRPGTAPNSELEQELVQPDIQCPSGDSLLKRIVAKCFPWKIRPSWLAGLATVLFGGSIAQAVVFLPDGESWRISPWIVAFLTHASSMGCLALIVSYGSRQTTAGCEIAEGSSVPSLPVRPLWQATAVSSCVGALLCVMAIFTFSNISLAWLAAWVSAVWLATSLARQSAGWFTAFQSAATVALVFATAAAIERLPWSASLVNRWLDPWCLQAIGTVLALWGLGWLLLATVLGRRVDNDRPSVHVTQLLRLVRPSWPAVDQVVRVGVLVLAVLLAIYAAVPGTAQELTPRRLAASLEHSNTLESRIIPATDHFEIRALPYDHAADWGGWLLLATATLPWLVAQWEKRHSINVMGLMLGAAAVCPLLATMFEVDIAVASAWRWLSAGLFLLTAGCIWGRRHIAACGTMLGWPPDGKLLTGASTKRITTALIVLSAAPLAGMLTYISLAALAQSSLDLTVRVVFPVTVASIVMGFIIWSVLRGEQSQSSEERLVWRGVASRLAAIMGAAPLVVVSMYAVTVALRGNPIAGPEPDTLFHVMGRAVSYAVPLLLGALALSGFAVRERSAKFALAAGLFFNASATAGYLLVAAKGGKPLDVELWIRVAQFNAIVSGLFVLAWSYALRWSRQTPPPDNLPGNASDELTAILRRSGMLTTYALFSVALHALPMTFGLVRLFINPTDVAEIAVVAGGWGWSMLLVVALACVSAVRSIGLRVGAAWFSIGCVATVFMAIFQLARFDRGDWLAYHSLLISLTAGSWFILLVDIWQRRRLDLVAVSAPRAGRSVELASSVLAITAIIFALREAVSQTHLWWSAATMIAIAALAAAFGFVRLRRWPAYASTCMMAMATALAWWQFASDGFAFVGRTVLDLANCIVIVQGLACVAWIGLERSITVSKQQSNNEQSSRRTCIVGCHRVIAALALIAVLGQVVLQILSQAAVGWSPLNTAILWMTIISAGVGCVACLWDARCKSTVAKLYIGGLVVAGMALGQYQLSPKMMLWIGTIFLSAYALLTSYLWSRRQGLATFARRLSIPVSDNEFAGQRWLVQFNGLLIAAVLTTATVVVLNYGEQSQRLAVGQAALLQTLSLGMLARGERRSQLQLATLVAAALASVLWGWAWLAPPQAGPLLNHGVVVTIVLTTLTALYGLGLAKFFPRQTEWTSAAGRLVPSLASATIIALAVVLGAEASYFVAGDAIPISLAGIIAVGCCLALLSAAVLVAALVPGRDPFKLSDRGRMNYVYAAEGLLALLFAHIRLTLPWLFHGILTQYWPLLIVTLAFCGVGLAEVFRRQRRDVLAEPLERTGAALPLLPALGFWLAPQGEYSLVLLAVGAVYASLAIMRRSFGFGVLAALAANGALWFHLSGINGLEFWRHPQLWMIPGSLCLLGAAYINRQQLSEGQMTSIRYFSASMIYLASTADVFLNGVAEAPWLPLVLAALSIIGVLGGMLLRVRAFLFLGTSFLLLSLSTIIWYAAVDLHQTWLLWLTVVAIGVAILALFALFEKKREDVLKVLNGLRNWSP